ncbi:hypothetical protein FXV77_12065 [Sphingobacterium phlebotomi]|uniref:Ig-like domain-containing protein n=1 Tax=Sphingobacterium phlebotomi TaxID=2605433 RepID=A0A5D4H5C4_9SPHI|nr:hypothetical protein [Sphingobacterium phlebotomi]TYR35807.1 hypothetical protein FXV77_12065 [Sphingobacterium phlebotomi]
MKRIIACGRYIYIGLLAALIVIGFSSCEKEERTSERLEQSMGLYTTSASLLIGEEITIEPKFAPGVTPKRTYEWTADNPEIITMEMNENYALTITALSEGTTNLTIASTDGVLSVRCPVQVIDGTVDVNINFGSGTNASFTDGWNLLSVFLDGGEIPDLLTKKGYSTNISMTVTQRFNTSGNSGEAETDTELDMPSSVSASFFYGNSGTTMNGLTTGQSVLTLAGFDTSKAYDFYFFGSSTFAGTRSARYTVAGVNEESTELNASLNTSNVAYIPGIQPDENGEIIITVAAAEGNATAQKLYYINAMRFTAVE